ncbi:MAG: NosD domain-containing protein, partial [Nanoarchaeota archaeon]
MKGSAEERLELADSLLAIREERRKFEQGYHGLDSSSLSEEQKLNLEEQLNQYRELESNASKKLAKTQRLKPTALLWTEIAAGLIGIILGVIFVLNPALIGLVVQPAEHYNIELDVNISNNQTLYFDLNGSLTSLLLTGNYTGGGYVNVWLRSGENRYLILDRSSILGNGVVAITPFAIADTLNEEETNGTPEDSPDNEVAATQNETEFNPEIEANLTDEDNQTNETANDVKVTISAELIYGTTPAFDSDNDGVELSTGGIDYQITTQEDISAYELCSQWEVYSLEAEASVYACYGSEACCALSDLKPSFDSWSQPFILTKDKQGATENNTVSARIVALNSSDFTAITSDWKSLTGKFVEQEETQKIYRFSGLCKETCVLDSLNGSGLSIEVEIENGTLTLSSLSFSAILTEQITINETNLTNITNISLTNETLEELEQLPAEIGKPVKWIKRLNSKKEIVNLELPEFASNISVYKNDNKLDDYKVSIKHQGKEFTPETFDIEKKIKKLEKARGSGIQRTETPENLSLTLSDANGSLEIAYETAPPVAFEENVSANKKIVTISSDLRYTNVTAYAAIPDSRAKVFWLVSPQDYKTYYDSSYEGTELQRVLINGDSRFAVTYIDSNNDSFIDSVSWVVPHLSNQSYEISIVILNPVTYLRDGETWVVAFNTTGTANLTINSTNAFWEEMQSDNVDTFDEMRFLNLSCGQNDLRDSIKIRDYSDNEYSYNQIMQSDSIRPKDFFIPDYYCNETAYFSNHMKKAGYANLTFTFGNFTAFALDPSVTECQNLTTVDSVYTLSNNINSTGTCIFITNNNITLDCGGFTINYSETSAAPAIWTNGTNAVIKNCVINKTGGTGSDNYGIYVFASNATIFNNSIYTNGTSSNYGILLEGSGNTRLENNSIFASGNAGFNFGVRLAGSGNHSVLNNSVHSFGTNDNYGLFVSAGGLNLLSGNVVVANGSADNNFGIYLTGSGNNSVLNNSIHTNGTSSNYGLYVGSGGLNLLSGNVVVAGGSTTTNYGIILAGSGNNTVSNNTVTSNGTNSNYGLYVFDGGLNLLSGNVVVAGGSGNFNFGIRLAGSGNHSVLNNSVHSFGTNDNYGLFVSAGGLNLLSGNVVVANGSADNNFGVYLAGSGNNTILNNTVRTNGTLNNYGLVVLFNNNSIIGNIVVSGGTSTNNNALYLYRANSSQIANNFFTVGSNSGVGINLSESGNSMIYNNIFNGSKVAALSDNLFSNSWNTTVVAGTNIMGGSNLGGNFYANSSNGEFSETCVDNDGNGICDSSYIIASGNIDYYPLAIRYPLYTCQNLTVANRYYTLSNSVNSTGTCFYIINNNITLDCQGYIVNYSETINQAGIWTNGSNTVIKNCIINKTGGTGANNYGIYVFDRNASLKNNSIYTNGTNYNYGVYVSGSGNTSIVNNTIFTRGNSFSNYGIYLTVGNNTVVNNSITTDGTESNYGLYGFAGGLNFISGNTVNTGGSDYFNYGIFLQSSGNNSVLNNTVHTSGSFENYGLYLLTSGFNTVSGNVVVSTGSSGSQNYGIYLSISVNNSVLNNFINTDGQARNYGLYIASMYNSFTGNILSTNGTNNDNYGIYLTASNNSVVNNSVRTNGVSRNYGVYVRSHNNSISGNVVLSGGSSIDNHGIYLYRANWSVIANNSFTVGSSSGVGINVTEAGNNTIYNNLFNGTKVAAWSDTVFSNQWNTSIHSGINILGGPFLAGNYYANSSSGEFSDTCIDDDVNGICDATNTLATNNVDFFPLSGKIYYVSACQNLTTPGKYALVNSVNSSGTCIQIFNHNITLNCLGYNINHSESVAGGKGITINSSRVTVSNCIIGGFDTSGDDNYGIYASNPASNLSIRNNTINTNGRFTNYGIYFASIGSSNNSIVGNNIKTNAIYQHNYGIYLFGASADILNNSVTTGGTSFNYGVYLRSDFNKSFSNNIIFTNGTSSDNYGVYLRSSSYNNISNNSIMTQGSQDDYGLYIFSSSENNTIYGNTINTNGTTDYNHGIYLSTGASANNIFNNSINTLGRNFHYGVFLDSSSNNNNISTNLINTFCSNRASESTNYGAYLSSSTGNNIINNTVRTCGSGSNYGVYLATSNNNSVSGNLIVANGSTTLNYGVYLLTSLDNKISNNIITTNGTTDNYGIFLSSSHNNSATNNSVVTLGSSIRNHGLYLLLSNTSTIANNSFTVGSVGTGVGVNITNGWGNVLFNNLFNGSSNSFSINTTYSNDWNTTLQTVTSIMGGPKTGGNFFTTRNSQGFSNNCTDSNLDYICDNHYNLSNNNIDYYPLASQTGRLAQCGNLTLPGNYTLINSVNSTGTCFHIINNNITLDCGGFTVNYSETINQAGIWTNGSDAVIKNCIINKTGGTGSNNYGI